MTPPEYEIHSRAPAQVERELMRIWGDNLPVQGTVAEKFQWLYRDAEDLPNTVFTLSADDKIVGTAGVLNRRFQVGDQDVRTALLANLAVDRDHRSVLPALRLVRAAHKHAMAEYGFAYGFPNKHAIGVFKRARFKVLGNVIRYARVLRYAHYVDRGSDRMPRVVAKAMKNPVIARVAGAVADVGRLTVEASQSAGNIARFRLTWLDDVDARFDELWQRARQDYCVVGERSAAFLRWRYPAQDSCRIAALVERKTNTLCAYALIQQQDRVAHIRDLFGCRNNLGALLDLLMPSLYAHRATSVSFHYLGAKRMLDVLTAHGFVARETARTIAIAVAPAMKDHAAVIQTSEHWHLTDLDEDV